MLITAGMQLAPIVREARTLGQFVAPAHQRLGALAQNLWWSWDRGHRRACSASSIPVLWRELDQQSRRPAPADIRSTSSRNAPRSWGCTAASTTPTAGCRSTCNSTTHLGRSTCRRAVGAARRVFLGRVRAARIAADLFGRPGHSGRRPPQERVGPRHSARRRRAVLRPGLFPPAAGSRRVAARRLHRRRSPRCCRCNRRPSDGAPITIAIDTRTGTIGARVWQLSVGRNTLLLLDSERRRQSPGRPRADGPALRRRRARPHPPGTVARRRRRARPRGHGHRAGRRCTSTKGTAHSPHSNSCGSA